MIFLKSVKSSQHVFKKKRKMYKLILFLVNLVKLKIKRYTIVYTLKLKTINFFFVFYNCLFRFYFLSKKNPSVFTDIVYCILYI